MKKVLVTGGAGFIGSNLVTELLNNKYKVIVLDNFSSGDIKNLNENKNLEIVEGDIRDYDLLESLIKKVDIVVHLAAIVSVVDCENNPEACEVNVEATNKIFELAVENNIEKVIYASSAAVYGDVDVLPTRENFDLNPISKYGKYKLENEKKAKEMKGGTSFVGLRFQNVYGPKQNIKSDYAAVIPLFINLALQGKPIKIFGDGKQTRDFVFVKDVANAILLSINNKEKINDVFNIGTGKEISILDLRDKISKVLSIELETQFLDARDGEIKRSFADIEKAYLLFGYSSNHPFDEGLNQTIIFFKE